MATKYFYFVLTAVTVVILGLIHSMDYVARYQKPSDETHRELQETPRRPTKSAALTLNVTVSVGTNNKTALALRGVEQDISSDARAVVIFNVQPKSGSRTLYELVSKLKGSVRPEIVMKNTMGGYNQTHADKLHEMREFVYQSQVGFLYSHMRFQRLQIRNAERKPTFISIVRDPIDRLASLYYFVRFGDNIDDKSSAGKEFRERMAQKNLSAETFNECVLNGGLSCRDPGAMVRHFCGADKKVCSNSKAKAVAYERAIATIDKYYTAIGVMEDYVSTLRVFEALIPDLFEGVTEMYLEEKGDIVAKMKTKNKPSRVSSTARKRLRKEMGHDYKLYYYIKNKFHRMKINLGLAVSGRSQDVDA